MEGTTRMTWRELNDKLSSCIANLGSAPFFEIAENLTLE
jgi:hypothetical protein